MATNLVEPIEIVGTRHQNPLAVRQSGRRGNEEIHAVPIGKIHVADDDFRRRRLGDRSLDKGNAVAKRPAIRDLMATALEILANFTPKIRVVLDQKYTHTHPDASSNILLVFPECRVRT